MKTGFFRKLAVSGMRNNRKLYLPYIFTCIGTVMVYYILQSLSLSPVLSDMRGGTSMGAILSFGRFIILIFSLLFLFYTNSFLIRRRNKEFGLYNVLGTGKRGIYRIIVWESAIIAVLGIAGGTVLGILFSKIAELGLLNAVEAGVNYKFNISFKAVYQTAALYAVIFFLIMLRSLWQVRRSNPLELLKSEHYGEKPPKANWVLSALGILLLGAAYYISVTIKSPLTALELFFVAVIMVIAATYLIFVSASVAVCRILQKNKKYYYKKNHFVSISSMVYRMKRNGAGLASICILSTMVLVIVSSTSSLYFGKDKTLEYRYPEGNAISVTLKSAADFETGTDDKLCKFYRNDLKKNGCTPVKEVTYGYAHVTGALSGDRIKPEVEGTAYASLSSETVRQLFFVSEADFNRITGKNLKLNAGEAMLYTSRCKYDKSFLRIGEVNFKITGQLKEFINIDYANAVILPAFMLVIPDYNTLLPLEKLTDKYGTLLESRYYYGYDTNLPENREIEVFHTLMDDLEKSRVLGDEYSSYYGCKAEEKSDFLVTFGGLFFLGIVLSAMFICAAVLMIYYKQVCEGYEDRERFEIMQKVGMSKKDIKKSINSQVLTVFFAPLLFAGMHLGFAFPLIWKLLMLFSLTDLNYVISVSCVTFAVFGAFYAIVYKVTAKAYYSIVAK